MCGFSNMVCKILDAYGTFAVSTASACGQRCSVFIQFQGLKHASFANALESNCLTVLFTVQYVHIAQHTYDMP